MYPNVILMMTTNKDMDYFDHELDNSYLRNGRTTMKCPVKKPHSQ